MDVLTDEQLPATTPEEQGIPSSAILDFVAAVEERVDAMHAFVLVRHGHVVAQGAWSPYDLTSPRMVFSLSKSFTSSGVGLAVHEGLLSVDDRVLDFFADAAPSAPSEYLSRMRVRHLLTMTTGHSTESLVGPRRVTDDDWARTILAHPVEHEPGAHFVYNSGASYLLSAIVQKVTGETLLDYLRPRLLEPLGITDATWDTCPRGVNTGGWGLWVRVAEIARFGQLYLQNGRWGDRQLIPASWVADATAHQVDNNGDVIDWRQGYGYQFWRCRHGAYRGDGAFGQFCVVMPEQDAVLAIVGGVADMQGVLDVVWEHLLPAMGAGTLPGDGSARGLLERRLASLARPGPDGAASSPLARSVSGRTYRVRTDGPAGSADGEAGGGVEWIRLETGADGDAAAAGECRLTLGSERGVREIVGATGEWRSGRLDAVRWTDAPVAVRAAWADDHTLSLRVCVVRTP
ncbi:MAG TPA: serine hydrolase, partial [Actinopolymorphaceae bacterium]|nr:serine hydrolase [Actinopolymorphaceae bacterium]